MTPTSLPDVIDIAAKVRPVDPIGNVAAAVRELSRCLGCPVRASLVIEREDGYQNQIQIAPENKYNVQWGKGSNPFLRPPSPSQLRLSDLLTRKQRSEGNI